MFTLINIEIGKSSFFMSLCEFSFGSLFLVRVEPTDWNLDILFLRRPILWIVEKIKNLFGGK